MAKSRIQHQSFGCLAVYAGNAGLNDLYCPHYWLNALQSETARQIELCIKENLKLLLLQEEVESKQSINEMLFIVLRQETQRLEDKMDENTLAIKSLEQVTIQTNDKLDQLNSKFNQFNSKVDGGFSNIGKILQEISNKLG